MTQHVKGTGKEKSDTASSTPPEPVKDRPNVGIVEPGDYPEPARIDPPADEDAAAR
ncbi:MAG TPA: hypothetical protein VNI79_02120 [Sphingomicrobium sp.]|nr:hypothetical protein [Sphingomicrobium sp.]